MNLIAQRKMVTKTICLEKPKKEIFQKPQEISPPNEPN